MNVNLWGAIHGALIGMWLAGLAAGVPWVIAVAFIAFHSFMLCALVMSVAHRNREGRG